MLHDEIDLRYCQSCGIPLDVRGEDLLGTNYDNTKNEDYCIFCFQNGKFTREYVIDEACNTWSCLCNEHNQIVKSNYTEEEFKNMLKTRLPSLKRWNQKNKTRSIHHEIINRIQAHININLFDKFELESLSQSANLSKYHFLRIFKDITGENLFDYILRLRLDYIAHILITTELSLTQITQSVNYESKHSLSKAFKRYFGLSPSEYRNRHAYSKELFVKPLLDIKPRLSNVKDMFVLYRFIDQRFKTDKTLRNMWIELIAYSKKINMESFKSHHISISLDDPLITHLKKCRFCVGITVPEIIKPEGKYGVVQIPEGEYAVFTFHGDYAYLHTLYRDIYKSWLPQSGYRQKNTLSFEIYLNTPIDTDSSDLKTEVYIPVEKKYNVTDSIHK